MKSLLLIVMFICAGCTSQGQGPDLDPSQNETKKDCIVKPITIGVLDSGFGIVGHGSEVKHLCKYGHKDFTDDDISSDEFKTKDPVPSDFSVIGHGTNIVGIIDRYGSKSNVKFCIVVIKYVKTYEDDPMEISNEIKAIEYATELHLDFINLSEGGIRKSDREILAIKKYLKGGGHVLAAAGNIHSDLSKIPFYPAMDDPRIIVVGALNSEGKHLSMSNYGKSVRVWEPGENITGAGITLSGTSMATAIATGKILALKKNTCYKK